MASDGPERTRRSCDACHSAKARCGGDGVSPCPACIRRGRDCIYSVPGKRGPKTGVVKSLAQEIKVLREQLATGSRRVPKPPVLIDEGRVSAATAEANAPAAFALPISDATALLLAKERQLAIAMQLQQEQYARQRLGMALAPEHVSIAGVDGAAGAPLAVPPRRRSSGRRAGAAQYDGSHSSRSDDDSTVWTAPLPAGVAGVALAATRDSGDDDDGAPVLDLLGGASTGAGGGAAAGGGRVDAYDDEGVGDDDVNSDSDTSDSDFELQAGRSSKRARRERPPCQRHSHGGGAMPDGSLTPLLVSSGAIPAVVYSHRDAGIGSSRPGKAMLPPAEARFSAHDGARPPVAPSAAAAREVPEQRGAGGGSAASSAIPRYTALPFATFIPVDSEPPIAPHELEVRFIRLYFLFSNNLLPMVCKTNFYYAGLRLGVYDVIISVCEDTVPQCDHAGGDCASMTFVPFHHLRNVYASSAAAPRGTSFADATAPYPPIIGGAGGGGDDAAGMTGAAEGAVAGRKRRRPPAAAASSDDPAADGGGGGGITVGAARGRKRTLQMSREELIARHMAQLPPYYRSAQATTAKQLSAAKACYYGVLAVGARMDVKPHLADAYLARCREALTLAFDEPCVETISACLIVGYYTCGCAVNGDMRRSKLYISLANEMADGLDTTSTGSQRRNAGGAFAGDAPGGSGAATPGGGVVAGAGLPTARPAAPTAAPGGAQSPFLAAFAPTAAPPLHRGMPAGPAAAIPPGGIRLSGLATPLTAGVPGVDPALPSLAGLVGPGASLPAAADAPTPATPPGISNGDIDVSGPVGVPLDILLSVRFLAQLTSAYRTTASAAGWMRGDEWDSPRGKISRILAYVTTKTRRKVSTVDEIRAIAPSLLRALDEAEAIDVAAKIAGSMDFATHATIHVSRAVVQHACGNLEAALAFAERAIVVMDNVMRPLANFFVCSVFVQLIPVCLSGGRADLVSRILRYLSDLARVWPVGSILIAKAHRRIAYAAINQSMPAAMAQAALNVVASVSGQEIPTANTVQTPVQVHLVPPTAPAPAAAAASAGDATSALQPFVAASREGVTLLGAPVAVQPMTAPAIFPQFIEQTLPDGRAAAGRGVASASTSSGGGGGGGGERALTMDELIEIANEQRRAARKMKAEAAATATAARAGTGASTPLSGLALPPPQHLVDELNRQSPRWGPRAGVGAPGASSASTATTPGPASSRSAAAGIAPHLLVDTTLPSASPTSSARALTPLDHLAAVTTTFGEPLSEVGADDDDDDSLFGGVSSISTSQPTSRRAPHMRSAWAAGPPLSHTEGLAFHRDGDTRMGGASGDSADEGDGFTSGGRSMRGDDVSWGGGDGISLLNRGDGVPSFAQYPSSLGIVGRSVASRGRVAGSASTAAGGAGVAHGAAATPSTASVSAAAMAAAVMAPYEVGARRRSGSVSSLNSLSSLASASDTVGGYAPVTATSRMVGLPPTPTAVALGSGGRGGGGGRLPISGAMGGGRTSGLAADPAFDFMVHEGDEGLFEPITFAVPLMPLPSPGLAGFSEGGRGAIGSGSGLLGMPPGSAGGPTASPPQMLYASGGLESLPSAAFRLRSAEGDMGAASAAPGAGLGFPTGAPVPAAVAGAAAAAARGDGNAGAMPTSQPA